MFAAASRVCAIAVVPPKSKVHERNAVRIIFEMSFIGDSPFSKLVWSDLSVYEGRYH